LIRHGGSSGLPPSADVCPSRYRPRNPKDWVTDPSAQEDLEAQIESLIHRLHFQRAPEEVARTATDG
jgi:hypothetical protein